MRPGRLAGVPNAQTSVAAEDNVQVSPGLAIDSLGREPLLSEPRRALGWSRTDLTRGGGRRRRVSVMNLLIKGADLIGAGRQDVLMRDDVITQIGTLDASSPLTRPCLEAS